MSEVRVNIFDRERTVSGDLHGSFTDTLAASLAAEPETIDEFETALLRFIKIESDWTPLRGFRGQENMEPWDAGIVCIDLLHDTSPAQGVTSALEFDDFTEPWILDRNLVFLLDQPAQIRARAVLTVREDDSRAAGRERSEPLHQIVLARMPAQSAHRVDRGLHRDFLPMNRHELLAVHQRPPE